MGTGLQRQRAVRSGPDRSGSRDRRGTGTPAGRGRRDARPAYRRRAPGGAPARVDPRSVRLQPVARAADPQMTALREAIVLPLLFLTVALLGGLRVAAPVRFVPPPLIAIVVGLLLVAALIRAAVLVPRDFVGGQRTPLEQASGLTVLIALGAASVQVFTLLTPDRGLHHLLFG